MCGLEPGWDSELSLFKMADYDVSAREDSRDFWLNLAHFEMAF